ERPDAGRVTTGRPSHLGVTIAETRALSHDADIGEQTNDNAGADSDTVNRSNDRLGAVQHFVDDIARFLQDRDNLLVIAVRILDPVEVTARRERAPGSGQYGHTRFRIAIDHRPKIRQSLMHLSVGGIQLLGLAQGYPKNTRIAAFKYHVWKRGIIHDEFVPYKTEAGAPGAKREPDRAKPQLMVRPAKPWCAGLHL